MNGILWLRILLTGLGLELLYAVYITFTRWYDAGVLLNLLSINLLMLIGGYLVARKATSMQIVQGALVGVVGALFYIFATLNMVMKGNLPVDWNYFMEHLLKIASGALGGFIALRLSRSAAAKNSL